MYDFLDLSVTLSGFFLLESVLLLKFGRYRLQSSLARAGSLASSRLILLYGQTWFGMWTCCWGNLHQLLDQVDGVDIVHRVLDHSSHLLEPLEGTHD